jgi:putative FmdB family regulatory protein
MPIYEYECSNCRYYLEVMQKISDARLRKCPSCGKNTLQKLISAPVFRLKGSGWYETDFKSDQEQKRNLAAAEKEQAPADAKKTGEGGQAKEGTEAKSSGAAEGGAEAKSAGSDSSSESKASSSKPDKGESAPSGRKSAGASPPAASRSGGTARKGGAGKSSPKRPAAGSKAKSAKRRRRR